MEIIQENNTKKERTTIFIVSLLLFVISLSQTAFLTDSNGDNEMESILALLIGWMNIFGPGISWLANPLFLFSLLSLMANKLKWSLIFSFLAILFALSFLMFKTILISEAGHRGNITAYGIGYWLWISSFGICFLATINLQNKQREQKENNR